MEQMPLFNWEAQFNLMQFIGLGGAPQVQQFVQYLKDQWKLPTYLAPAFAIIGGILLNTAVAFLVNSNLRDAAIMGILTGFFASGWHEIAKK